MVSQFKKMWQQTKYRLVVLAIAGLVVIGVVVGLWYHHTSSDGAATVASAPMIQSVPGKGNPSEAYVQAQNEENALNAREARKKAQSFVPTITRQSFIGSPESFTSGNPDEMAQKTAKECAIQKVVYLYKPNPANCSLENLQLARKSGVTAEELLCQSCPCSTLRLAGYTAGELKGVGYTASDLKSCGYDINALKTAGFNAADLKAAGFSAAELRKLGFSAAELQKAGFDAAQLKSAGFSAADLKNAGFSAGDLIKAGFTATALKAAGYTAAELQKASQENPACSLSALKAAQAQGKTATELKALGCDAQSLQKAGFSLADLKAAGFDAAALKAAGFTAEQLRNAGFSAMDLKNAGFSSSDLKNAGFDAAALKAAGFSATELKGAGFSNADLKQAGFSNAEIKKANAELKTCDVQKLKDARLHGISATQLKSEGCGVAALKAAGFTAAELKNAGFNAKELKLAGFSPQDLKDAGFSAAELKAAGFTAADLKAMGFSADTLKGLGFKLSDLAAAGYSAKELKDAGFSAAALKAAGFDAGALKAAGFSADALKAAGFTAGQLKSAGFTAAQLKAAGFTAQALRDAGFSAAQLKEANFSALQLKNAGFTDGDLVRAGFPPPAGTAASGTAKGSTVSAVQAQANNPLVGTSVSPGIGGTQGGGIPSIDNNSPEARLRAIQQAQQARLDQQQRRDLTQQLQGQMNLQAQKLLAEWGNSHTQTYQQTVVPQTNTNSAGQENVALPKVKGPTIKAGTVMFAVLDTAVNSDEQSPIMARIVTGPLKDSKLLGQFTRVDKRVLIKFNLLNVQQLDRSIGINAVAIDPNTARTAVAGDVNNHYLLRYGTLFASAFLSGISDAILTSGTQAQCAFGICAVNKPDLNQTDYAFVGLGAVGKQYASAMGRNFNIPPTIKIPGGTGIGLLFMNDVTLPQPVTTKETENVQLSN